MIMNQKIFINNNTSKFVTLNIYSTEKISEFPIPTYNDKTAPLYEKLDKLVRDIIDLK